MSKLLKGIVLLFCTISAVQISNMTYIVMTSLRVPRRIIPNLMYDSRVLGNLSQAQKQSMPDFLNSINDQDHDNDNSDMLNDWRGNFNGGAKIDWLEEYSSSTVSPDQASEMLAQLSESDNPFRILDLYEHHDFQTDPDFYNDPRGPFLNNRYNIFTRDPEYCDSVDLYNMVNTSNWLDHRYYYSTHPFEYYHTYLRNAMEDVMGFGYERYLKSWRKVPLSKKVTMLYQYETDYRLLKSMGVDHTCISQSYMTGLGLSELGCKDKFAKNFNEYSAKYNSTPSCFESEDFFPKSFVLREKEQCENFFDYVQSEEYKEKKADHPIQFMIKVGSGSHEGKGIFLFDEDKEQELLEKYQYGNACGEIDNNLIAQRYLTDFLTVYGNHKFDFRIHLLVASTNPLQVYYHDGLVRASLQDYDPDSKDLKNHLTNVHVSDSIVKKTKNKAEKERLKRMQVQFLEDFQQYLLKEGKITSETWLDDYLRPSFQRAFAHIIRMSKHGFPKRSGAFRLAGMDFMMDQDLKLWYIEANLWPLYFKNYPEIWTFTKRMLNDMLDIEYAMLKSRINRVRNFIIQFTKDHVVTGEPYDAEELKARFNQINVDIIDPQFALKPENGWKKIVDLTRGDNEDAYFGLVDSSCFQDTDSLN